MGMVWYSWKVEDRSEKTTQNEAKRQIKTMKEFQTCKLEEGIYSIHTFPEF